MLTSIVFVKFTTIVVEKTPEVAIGHKILGIINMIFMRMFDGYGRNYPGRFNILIFHELCVFLNPCRTPVPSSNVFC